MKTLPYPPSPWGWLKSLGLLGIAHRLREPIAGRWRNGFEVQGNLEALSRAFLERYQPAPILNPWNKASGLWKGENKDFVPLAQELVDSTSERWRLAKQVYQAALQAAPDTLPPKTQKGELIKTFESALGVDPLWRQWFDSTLLLMQEQTAKSAQIKPIYSELINGGAIGKKELGNLYLRCCRQLWDFNGNIQAVAASYTKAAFLGESAPATTVPDALAGGFNPVSLQWREGMYLTKGEKAQPSGTNAPAATNPADFILIVEGLLWFSFAAKGSEDQPRPFYSLSPRLAHRSSGLGSKEATKKTTEAWLPLWSEEFLDLKDLKACFTQLQTPVDHKADGVDYALKLGREGQEGFEFSHFIRTTYLPRKGDGDYPIAAQIMPVGQGSDYGAAIARYRKQLAGFVYSQTSNKKAVPGQLELLLIRLEQAVLKLAQGTEQAAMEVLAVLGEVETHRESLAAILEKDWERFPTCPNLAPAFAAIARRSGPEGRLALSLAQLKLKPKRSLPATLQAAMESPEPIQWGISQANTKDLSLFLVGQTDDQLILYLAAALQHVKGWQPKPQKRSIPWVQMAALNQVARAGRDVRSLYTRLRQGRPLDSPHINRELAKADLPSIPIGAQSPQPLARAANLVFFL